MSEQINQHRRRFFGMTAIALAAVEFGVAGKAAAQSAPAAAPPDAEAGTHTSFEALKQVKAGVLDIGYAEAGRRMALSYCCCMVGPMTSIVSSMSRRCLPRQATG